ncbi:Secreted GGC family protein, partial [Cryptosporidium hominis]
MDNMGFFLMPSFFKMKIRRLKCLQFILLLLSFVSFKIFMFGMANANIDMNGPPDRVYYYPIGFNLASLFIGPGVGNFLSIDSQVTNFVSPCQFMHPITIQFIGSYPKSGMTPIKNIICDSVSLQKSLQKFQLGVDTVKVVKACTDIAQVLMESETTYTIFNGANNITIWLEGSKLVNIVKEFNEQLPDNIPQIMDRDVKYQFDPTIFGEDVMDKVGISTYLFKATSFPFKISVDYSEVVPGTNSHGTNIPVIEFSANITLSYEFSKQSSGLSSFWTPPTGFGGFFPMLVPNDKFSNGVLYTTYTEPGKHAGFVAWGNINIPITSPFVRIVPPSRIPGSEIVCTSNYDFYYPTNEEPDGSVKNYPRDLESLFNKDSSKIFRNTVAVQSYWNKIPFGANWYEQGFPVGSPNSQWIETGNYYGGCYFNGTFPLVPSSTNSGFANTICSTQSASISDVYKTAFYPPPLEFLQYGVSNMQTMITSILQYGVQSSSDSSSIFDFNSNVEFLGAYPSFHIFGATPGLQLTSPSPRLNVPFVQYSGRDLKAGDPFFNFNFQYMQDRFGHCSEPNGCWICSNPRVIPWKTEIIDQMNFTEFCASNLTVIPNSRMIALKFYYGNFEEDIPAQIASGFQSCLKSVPDRWIPVGLNTTEFTFKAGEYHTNTMFIYNTLSNDTCCSPMNTYYYFQHYYTIVTDIYQPIQLTQITPYTDPYAGGILPGIFMSRNFSYQFYMDVYPDNTWTENSQLKLRSWLMCPEIENIDLIVMPESLLLGDVLISGGKVGGSVKIPPFVLSKFYGSPTYCILRAFIFVNDIVEKNNIELLKAVSLNEYEKLNPRVYRSDEGMHEYAQWIFVNNGFLAKSSNILEPHPGKTSISDALYTPVNVTHHYNFTITPFLFSAVALNKPVFSPDSQIFEMVLSGQHNRFGLRLPPTHSKWYVFTRTADKWDQGCFVECEGDMSRSPYAEWCLPKFVENNPFNYNLCNYTVVTTSPDISESQIEDAIAVVTNPISYLSYVDTMSLVNAIFSLPATFELVWGKYFQLIYETAIDSHNISFNQDYPFAQPTTLAVINRILSKHYYRERLDIKTSLPFNSIQRIYTLVECFLVNGLDNLVLNSTDLIGATNPLPELSPENLKILLSIYQGVASRKSYTHGAQDTYSIITEKTGNIVFSSTFNQVDMNKGVKVGGISFPKIDMKSIKPEDILFHNGVYYRVNKKLYENNLAIEGFNFCAKSFNTITVIRTGGYLSNYLVTKSLENIEEFPLAFTSFVLCTLEYEIWNLENNVELSFFAEYKEELDYSEVKCTAMKQDQSELSDELCTTERVKHFTNQTIEFKCGCSAITYYGLKGKPIPYIPTLSDKDLKPLFSKSRPNILQPYMLISNPKLSTYCNDFLPIIIQLKNIPDFVPDESLSLNFKCVIPNSAYSSLEFCTKFENELQYMDYSFSRLGQNINLTYYVKPDIIQRTALPIKQSFWRPLNQQDELPQINGVAGVTVLLNITLELSKLGLGNNLPDLFGYSTFDIITSIETSTKEQASEIGELSTTYIPSKLINFPGAFTKSKVPVSSIIEHVIPYSIPYNSLENCPSFLNNYFSSNYLKSIEFEMSEGLGISKDSCFNPELLSSIGSCRISITNEEYIKGGSFDCIKSTSRKNLEMNILEQPISMINVTKLSTKNSFASSKDKVIFHNETIQPSINAYFSSIVSKNHPKITIETGTSKTIDQIVSQSGYCDSIKTGCSSCRASRSYQADFQFQNQEIRYYCSATSDENQVEDLTTGLLAACRTDGSYWGQACSFQQSNATLSGNATYTELTLIPQESLTHMVIAVGIKSKIIDAIECKNFYLSMVNKELPLQIIPHKIPSIISKASESLLLAKIKFIGGNEWDNVQGLKFLSFAYFENTGYVQLKTTPSVYNLKDQAIQNDLIAVSIKLNITETDVNPRDGRLSVILLVIKQNSNEIINENKLNIIVKRSNIHNLASSGDYVSYVWDDLLFQHDFSLIKIKGTTENKGPREIIPINFKISNLAGMSNWKYSILATLSENGLDNEQNNKFKSNALLLSFLTSNIPQYLRLPTNYESWKIHLIIHNQDNELLCGIDCSEINNDAIDKHLRNMFCVKSSSSKCNYFIFQKSKKIFEVGQVFLKEDELKEEYSNLLEYFLNYQKIGTLNDRLMIASILSAKLDFLTIDQIEKFQEKLIEIDPNNKDTTGGNSVMILYIFWRLFEFSYRNFDKALPSHSFDPERLFRIALKAECGYFEGFKNLIVDILDFLVELRLLSNIEADTNLFGAFSVNQWAMNNDFGSQIEIKGKMTKLSIQSSIFSDLDLHSGAAIGNELVIPTLDLSNEKLENIDISLIKNIYFKLHHENVDYQEFWGRNLFINCHDPRYGLTIIKPPLYDYLFELANKIQQDKSFNGVFQKVYDVFISKCGYEYRLYGIENKISFIVSPEYTPSVVLGKRLSYQCTYKGKDGSWYQNGCETKLKQGKIVCSCNSIGEYGLITTYQSSLTEVVVKLSHNPGSIQEVNINGIIYKVNNGKFYYNNQVFDIISNEIITIYPDRVTVGKRQFPLENYFNYDVVTQLTLRQEGVLGTISLRSKEYNVDIEGSSIVHDGFNQGNYSQNSTIIII